MRGAPAEGLVGQGHTLPQAEDDRSPAGFPRWTAGQVWPWGQGTAGGSGKPVSGLAGRTVNQLTCNRLGRS